jgi:hypothetical protein
MPFDDKGPKPKRNEDPEHPSSLVEQGMAFVRALHAESAPAKEQIVDSAFIDELYGEP